MAILLSRVYGPYAAGTTLIAPADTESALVSQGYGTLVAGIVQSYPIGEFGQQVATVGGNVIALPSVPLAPQAVPQGPRILPNVGSLTAFAAAGTNTTLVAGTLYRAEIYVPHYAQWTGIQVLNGATVGTDNGLVVLSDSNGVLVANSALAGALAAGANAFQQRAFLNAPFLAPGRYFLAYQSNGITATLRTQAAADGGNAMTSSSPGTFGTIGTVGGAAFFIPPTTFLANVGPIAALYQ